MVDFIRNKQLYVLNDDNTYSPLYTVNNEIFLTADHIEGLFSFDDYYRAVTSPFSKRVPKMYLLNDDETIKQDVTEYINACTLTLDSEQGKSCSASVTFLNTDGLWTPSPVNGHLWKGTKFRIDVGLYYNGTVFWGRYGILSPADFSIDDESKTVQCQMYDKFAFLDGTITGKIDSDFKIPVGTSVRVAIESCLTAEKENGGRYDPKPVIFHTSKTTVCTPYTITKSPGVTYGEIINELADMISCDVYYNEYGHLVVSGNSDAVQLNDRPVLWSFDDITRLYTQPSISIDLSKVVNKVTVVGAIVNGYRFKGVAVNRNASSQTNIYMTDINTEYIEDSNITSDELCQERAEYELQKKTLLGLQTKFQCVFIPNILPRYLITWTNEQHGFLNEKFYINSISFDALNPTLMELSLTNVREISNF